MIMEKSYGQWGLWRGVRMSVWWGGHTGVDAWMHSRWLWGKFYGVNRSSDSCGWVMSFLITNSSLSSVISSNKLFHHAASSRKSHPWLAWPPPNKLLCPTWLPRLWTLTVPPKFHPTNPHSPAQLPPDNPHCIASRTSRLDLTFILEKKTWVIIIV
jgi:hypothetical protein